MGTISLVAYGWNIKSENAINIQNVYQVNKIVDSTKHELGDELIIDNVRYIYKYVINNINKKYIGEDSIKLLLLEICIHTKTIKKFIQITRTGSEIQLNDTMRQTATYLIHIMSTNDGNSSLQALYKLLIKTGRIK